MPPPDTPKECFARRRDRLLELHPAPAGFGSGLARIRNFEANRFPFRAESHFLYFVGKHVEGALLYFEDGQATLYAPGPDPAEGLWRRQQSLSELSETLGIEVRPSEDVEFAADVATIAPNDVESAMAVEETLGRVVEPGSASDPGELDAELVDCMIELRLRHDDGAVAQLEAAADVTIEAHLEGMRATTRAAYESEVRAAMEGVIAKRRMAPAYSSIVTTEGEVLHHEQSLLRLEPGALLLADVGAESAEGWASDVTRTWPCSGTFTPLQRQVYETVLEAQQAAIAMLAPGVRFLEVHRKAASVLVEGLVDLGLFKGDVDGLLERGAAALFFPHGIGHLLGLDVHDMEDLGDRASYAEGRTRSEEPAERFLRLDRDLEPSMLVTIEPGFYVLPQKLDTKEGRGALSEAIDEAVLSEIRKEVRGIRIEDDVLITEGGSRVLTSGCPKTPDEIERVLAE